MRRVRAHLTYANIIATLALFLALSGGAVWAANKVTSKQIGKGAVKTKNLAKNAVKKKNLAKNSVTSPKLAKNAVKNADVADGAINFAKLAAGTNVVASATGGPIAANQDGPVNIPLNPPINVTPTAGQPLTLNIEARGTLVPTGAENCRAAFIPVINGAPRLAFEVLSIFSPDNPPEPPFPNGVPVGAISFPIGLTQSGAAQSVGVQMIGDDEDCKPESRVDQVAVVVTQAK
jgi:hypothetical protein